MSEPKTTYPKAGEHFDLCPLGQIHDPDELRRWGLAITAIDDECVTDETIVQYLEILRGAAHGLAALVGDGALGSRALNDVGTVRGKHLRRTIKILRSVG